MRTAEQAPRAFKAETPAPNNTLNLPDGQVLDNLDPQSYNFKILKLLTDRTTKIPFEDIEKLDPDFKGGNGRRGRKLAHATISKCRPVLIPLGWTIVVRRQSGENKMLHTFVSLEKAEEPKRDNQDKDGDSAQKSQPKNSKSKSPYLVDLEGTRDFFRKLREQLPDLYKEDNGSVSTSSPEPESPKGEVRS